MSEVHIRVDGYMCFDDDRRPGVSHKGPILNVEASVRGIRNTLDVADPRVSEKLDHTNEANGYGLGAIGYHMMPIDFDHGLHGPVGGPSDSSVHLGEVALRGHVLEHLDEMLINPNGHG